MMKTILLAFIFAAPQLSLPAQPHTEVDLCKVVMASSEYNRKVLTVEGVLYPSDHSLALYSPSCAPREGSDVSMQAVLPTAWESWPKSKRLRTLLIKKRKPAHVKVTGLFESGVDRYGPDIARFRFTISEISSVGEAPPSIHP
jgi:hypothetical protein